MVCSICGQSGHNRRTCPQRNPNITQVAISFGPTPPHNPPPNRRALTRKLWRTTIQTVLDLKRFVRVSRLLNKNIDRLKYSYFRWIKIKDLFNNRISGDYTFGDCIRDVFGKFNSSYTHYVLECTNQACLEFHKARNPVKDNKRTIKLINMRNENYLIYWVLGNLMIEDIDSKENSINYIGMLRKNGTFGLSTAIGHRFYLVPHKLDIEPPYHPQTDKQFFIEPYLQLNIHEDSNKEIHIDEGEKLSELNRWKFNALKLDYLIREMIKLGAKNNETLDIVLDLHEDIHLDDVGEWYKDIAGVPSTFTNIT
tara:strand:- start:2584 stop:3513 length:930 start_codon:yes stop_codon:yes gene_type:complete